jgi:hypothetical protein
MRRLLSRSPQHVHSLPPRKFANQRTVFAKSEEREQPRAVASVFAGKEYPQREQANDYRDILAMIPRGFPGRDDVVSAIFEDLLTGTLKRDDVRSRIQTYVSAHNQMFPTKYRKFGDAALLSLDEVMYDDGTATRGDTVSRGLWD